jgi:hypothetical protein
MVTPARASSITPVITSFPPSSSGRLSMNSSALQPDCKAEECIFQWMGINTPPRNTIDVPIIHMLASIASRASLRDTKSYGAGLRKFHIFCDVFSIPEKDQLPASFELLHSFAIWAVTDPNLLDPSITADCNDFLSRQPPPQIVGGSSLRSQIHN